MDDYALVVNVDAAVVRGDDYLVIERSSDEEHAAGTLAFPGGGRSNPTPQETRSGKRRAGRSVRRSAWRPATSST